MGAPLPTPQSAAEVTPEWLTVALRDGGVLRDGAVVACATTTIGEGLGFLSRVLRVGLTYRGAAAGAPASVVVKLEPDAGSFHDFGDELHAFAREIRFYREVAAVVPVRLPRCYYAADAGPHFAIVMEDLSFATPGDQVAGMHAAQVLATVRLIAGLQARFWDNAALAALTWMPTSNVLGFDYEAKWASLLQHFGALVGAGGRAVGERLRGRIDWLEAEIAARPRTIVHSDLRADNLLFGPPDGPDAVLIVDWQLAIRSMGAFDVARLLGGSALPGERRGHELEVLRAWYDALRAAGVRDYSAAEAERDFRLGALSVLLFPVHFHTGVIDSSGRARAVAEAIIRRLFASAAEIDAAAVLP
ncbi:MAG: phosphotransferase [Deltaproteobacteria bacterium]|nr:phosphotransferase [Deltaproteobacteria bacterium]